MQSLQQTPDRRQHESILSHLNQGYVMCEICSKLTMKTPEDTFIGNFDHI